jgi:hypothetical protein
LSLPRWEPDPHFDINSHLHRIALPAPGDEVALQALAGDLMSTPLDFTKPLWQMHLVENYHSGSALIVRLHHCMADGLTLVGPSITDKSRTRPGLAAEERPVVVGRTAQTRHQHGEHAPRTGCTIAGHGKSHPSA